MISYVLLFVVFRFIIMGRGGWWRSYRSLEKNSKVKTLRTQVHKSPRNLRIIDSVGFCELVFLVLKIFLLSLFPAGMRYRKLLPHIHRKGIRIFSYGDIV